MAGLGSLDEEARKALSMSFLAKFPKTTLDKLLSEVIRIDLPAGSIPYREMETPITGLVIKGLIRVFLVSPDGRQATIRYVRPGGILGIATVSGGPVAVNIQTITDTSALFFSPGTIEDLAKSDVEIAWLLAGENSRRLYAVLEEIAINTFGSIRERTSHHLLNIAANRQKEGDKALVAMVTQQEIANAVGSVREVIARTLTQLSTEGLIKNTKEGIEITDPVRLLSIAHESVR